MPAFFFIKTLLSKISITGWLCVFTVLTVIMVIVQTNRLRATKAEYSAFVADVRAKGEAQEKATQEAIKRQQRSSDEAEKRSKRALADITAKYDRLRQSSSYRGLVPRVPETTPVPDDGARDSRLLEVLRIAEEQTRRLEDLQAWVREQQAIR